jgi:hypothetical protein
MSDDSPADRNPHLPPDRSTSDEPAVSSVVAGLILGSVALIVGEQACGHLLGIATVPTSRQQRLLIVAQVTIWAGLCAAITAWLLTTQWFARRAVLGSERSRVYLGPGLWCLGVTELLSALWGSAVVVAMAVVILLFAGYRSGAARFSRLAQAGPLPLIAVVLWASTLVARWRHSSELSTLGSGVAVVLGLSIAATLARWRSPTSRLGRRISLLTLVAIVALELPAEGQHVLLLLGVVAYVAAVALEAAAEPPARAKVCWCAAIVATALLPLVRSHTDADYVASGVVAGVAVAMLLEGCFPRGLTEAGRVAADFFSRRSLGFLACVGAVLAAPDMTAAIVGSGQGVWDRLFRAPAASLARDGPRNRARARDRWIVGSLMATAVVARLVFWLVTDRVWEDALITIRHAENAVAGRGLTHHPAHGRVHGFTSPLSVLVPLAGEEIHRGGGLAALRIASLAAGALTVWLAWKVARHPEVNLSTPAMVFWLSYYALEHSQISFGMAGMETQLWTCVLVGGVAAVLYGRLVWLALALALAALCRPESFLWVGCASVAWLWQQGWRRFVALAGLVSLGVAPWIGFTTWYYGSPVPNTIRAKSAGYLHNTEIQFRYPNFLSYAVAELGEQMGTVRSLIPPHFAGHGFSTISTVPCSGQVTALLIWLGAMGAVALMRRRTLFIPVLLAGMLVFFLLVVRIIFPWYPPPLIGLAALLAAVGIDVSGRVFPEGAERARRWVLGIGLTALFVIPLPQTFATERLIQELIEVRVRQRVGLWLRDHAGPDDYVAAECLGYFGYYSGLPFHDYPGLSSPRAVAALKTTGGKDRFFSPIVAILRPTWVVVRTRELGSVPPEYELMQKIGLDAAEKAALSRYLPIHTNDDEFYIFRRTSGAPGGPAS